MSERLSIVVPSDMNEEIEKLQKIFNMDKNTVIRHLLSKSIREFKIETAVNEYKKGKLSLGKAAELADINLWEFIEICRKNQIQLDLTEEEAEMGIEKIKELNLNDYKQKVKDSLNKFKNQEI
jgi:predicted HTH domain antitoxin